MTPVSTAVPTMPVVHQQELDRKCHVGEQCGPLVEILDQRHLNFMRTGLGLTPDTENLLHRENDHDSVPRHPAMGSFHNDSGCFFGFGLLGKNFNSGMRHKPVPAEEIGG